MRRLLCIFLMLMLPLQAFAMQGSSLALAEMFDIAHELAHIERASHHHDEHGAPHYDDSRESAQHFAEHSASSPCIALPSELSPVPAPEPFKVVRADSGQYLPDHIPERPQRPPQSRG